VLLDLLLLLLTIGLLSWTEYLLRVLLGLLLEGERDGSRVHLRLLRLLRHG